MPPVVMETIFGVFRLSKQYMIMVGRLIPDPCIGCWFETKPQARVIASQNRAGLKWPLLYTLDRFEQFQQKIGDDRQKNFMLSGI